MLKIGIAIADEGKIFGHIANLINECRSSALNALNLSILMEIKTTLFTKGMSTHDKKFWYMFGFVKFGLASCAIHLKLYVYYKSKRLINLKSFLD